MAVKVKEVQEWRGLVVKGYDLSDVMNSGHALFWDKKTWFTKL